MGGRTFDLGAGGISAYQKLKLETALADLARPVATSTGPVRDALDIFSSTLPRVSSESNIAESDLSRLLSAADSLSALSQDSDGLKVTADSILTLSTAFDTALKKKDTKKLADSAIELAGLLTDFAYAVGEEEKPLAPLREAPGYRPKQ